MSAHSLSSLPQAHNFSRDSHQHGVSLQLLRQPERLMRRQQPVAGTDFRVRLFVCNRHAQQAEFRADLRRALHDVRQIYPLIPCVPIAHRGLSFSEKQYEKQGFSDHIYKHVFHTLNGVSA